MEIPRGSSCIPASTGNEKIAIFIQDDKNEGRGAEDGSTPKYPQAKEELGLNPKPTADRLDPLNFPKLQKWGCLGIVMWMYFLFTYITTTTVPSFALLQSEFDISYAQVNWTVAIPALGLALGPLFWSSPAHIYGRRPILLIGTLIALIATIGSAVTSTYAGYMASRFFQGFGVSPAATVGMAVVNDLFFECERGQKLGLWVLALDLGLLVGPLIGGFITLVDQHWVAWLTAILFGGLLGAELLLLPETLYPRNLMLSKLSTTTTTMDVANPTSDAEKSFNAIGAPEDSDILHMPRTKKLPFFNTMKVPGIQHPKPWDAIVQFGKMWTFPNVVVAVFFYCFAWYWWVMSVITYLPVAYSQYSPQIQGLLFLGLILGTLSSEIFCSGTLSDALVLKLAKRNGNSRAAEMRLWLVYPAIFITVVGLVLWGISVNRRWHWFVGQVALFLFAAGIQIGNTAISTYIIDCYPLHPMSVITFYSVLLNLSAFVNPFLIAPWCASSGMLWTFTAQAAVVVGVMVPVTATLQIFGERWRVWSGAPRWRVEC